MTSSRAPLSETRWQAAVFTALLLILLAFAPGTNRWMGYSQEENDAALGLVDRLTGSAANETISVFTRHGFIATLFRLPFAGAARLLGGDTGSERSPIAEGVLSLESQVATAALLTLLALWVARVTGSRRRALLAATAALFTTPLWPYAYLGLETTQSLLLFAAGFLALAPILRWRPAHDALFVLAVALAGSAKTTSLFYWPMLLWLILRAERRRRLAPEAPRRSLVPWAIGALIATRLASFAAIERYREHAADFFPGLSLSGALGKLIVDSPFELVAHLHGMTFSWNKGWLIFAPLALAGLAAGLADWSGRPGSDAAKFAWGSFLCLALGFGVMTIWSEETWGPRYLQSAVAPAVLALALFRPVAGLASGAARRRLTQWLLIVLAASGLLVNALGVAVHYSALYKSTLAAGENTLEAVQYDPLWNHPRFNAWVLREWARSPRDAAARARPFPLLRRWWWLEAPESIPPTRQVEIAPWIRPQPLALRVLVGGESPSLRPVACGLLLAGGVGLFLLLRLSRRTR